MSDSTKCARRSRSGLTAATSKALNPPHITQMEYAMAAHSAYNTKTATLKCTQIANSVSRRQYTKQLRCRPARSSPRSSSRPRSGPINPAQNVVKPANRAPVASEPVAACPARTKPSNDIVMGSRARNDDNVQRCQVRCVMSPPIPSRTSTRAAADAASGGGDGSDPVESRAIIAAGLGAWRACQNGTCWGARSQHSWDRRTGPGLLRHPRRPDDPLHQAYSTYTFMHCVRRSGPQG